MKINCINIANINNDHYQIFRNSVSGERKQKADRYHFINDSKRSICAELLLQYSLYQSFRHIVPLDIGYNKFGKPFLNNIRDFSYNLSHSGDWVVIAYGNSEVGIDIEKIHIGKEYNLDHYFSAEEKSYLHSATGAERNQRFIQLWTLKESYLKYIGTGLSTKLDSFSVNAINGILTFSNNEIQSDIRLKSYRFDSDYYMSICSMEKNIIINKISIDQMIQFINQTSEEQKSQLEQ